MRETQTVTIETRLPTRLFEAATSFVDQGWVRSMDELVLDAVRRYLESHGKELTEEFIRDDVAWGLYGEG